MSIDRSTQLGTINISSDAIAMLAGGVVMECYGVVGMASQKLLKDGFAELLKRDNFSEKELNQIAEILNATFEGNFVLNDTGKSI